MFGLQNDQTMDNVGGAAPGSGATGYSDPAFNQTMPTADLSAPSPVSDPLGTGSYSTPVVEEPMNSTDNDPLQDNTPSFTPFADEPTSTPAVSDTTAQPPTDDLLAIKQQALEQLSPMVDQLDQEPTDKFKTLMMMIQATDDHTKLAEAFTIAKQITDDKARAQALLDVINEINYFTQNHNGQ